MESIHWSRFLGSLKVLKHHLCSFGYCQARTKVSSLGRAGYHFKHAEVEDKERKREKDREREEL
jgi:hypothetical protein